MIRHVVMFRYKEAAEGRTARENAELVKEMLLALPNKIEGIKFTQVGINHPDANSDNDTLCLISDFDNFEELNRYLVHPEHVKVGEFMKKVRISRNCVDFEILD